HQPALQTSVLLVHAHLSTLIEHGHVASVNQPRRAMASFKERLRLLSIARLNIASSRTFEVI
ncbi:hypothetical protein, partial [Burkholderia glumae]|uniref:hypothetical protein n=1 Tax=Burkholderia glumae TaxID=337 RepID=UPI0020CCD92A